MTVPSDRNIVLKETEKKQVQRLRTRNTENVAYENCSDPCGDALGTVKTFMVENIEKVLERATTTEIKKTCTLEFEQIFKKVLCLLTD